MNYSHFQFRITTRQRRQPDPPT